MKTMDISEIKIVSGGVNPLLLPAVVIYLPNILVQVPAEAPTVDK